jgi:arginase
MRWSITDAPSNLGLRPPGPGLVPGVYKLAGSLRDRGLKERLRAAEGGSVTPPRYEPNWEPGSVRNELAIERYSRSLAERIEAQIDRGLAPLVLGGDCSILLGPMLALRRRGSFGLAFIDAHSDFRHPGNSTAVGAAAGEDLALVTGRGGKLANLEGMGPLARDHDVVAVGVRDSDDYLEEMRLAGIDVLTSSVVMEREPAAAARAVLDSFEGRSLEGFWIHCDIDVLDPKFMPAVDTPTPRGIDFDALRVLLSALLRSSLAVGMDVTIFDPDLDEDGHLADQLVECLCDALMARG